MRLLIQKYNHQEALLMVSLYPKKGELYSAGTSGAASYAKNVVRNMKRVVVVLADIVGKPEIYEENKVLVYRCFRKNSPLMWLQILKAMIRFGNIKNLLIQLDFAMYGGVATTSFVIPFMAIIRLFGYKSNVVMHHVVTDIFRLKGHVGLGDGILDSLKGFFYNKIFHTFYLLLSFISEKIIVLEEVLKERLSTVISTDKIVTIPHGVDSDIVPIPKNVARERLGVNKDDYFILFFGYVNWFKGADFFVDAYGKTKELLGKRVHFVIAGGKSPTLKDREYYKRYFSDVLEKVYNSHNIQITGYVPQEEIGIYFSAADLVVLPYRNFMTASGVFSLVFSHKKPFVLSSELGVMFDETDFKKAFESVNLTKEDVTFQLTERSCLNVTRNVLKDGLKSKMINVAQMIRRERDYKKVALIFEKLVFSPSYTLTKPLALGYTQ